VSTGGDGQFDAPVDVPVDIPANVAAVRTRIAAAARRAGRDPGEITLVAATKTVVVERVAEVIAAGVVDLGENRAQELLAKAPALVERGPRWHFLGALQRNKVKALAPWIACWQSVDREALGDSIARHAPGSRVLVEVNLAREPQKAGCAPEALPMLIDALVGQGLVVDGLMTVPPQGDDPRPWFTQLRGLASGQGLATLSMGMTDDFEVAVEEGATMVRVGRALFGPRHHSQEAGR
jgi:pyridoxal phosphate enzyme (YggS family)